MGCNLLALNVFEQCFRVHSMQGRDDPRGVDHLTPPFSEIVLPDSPEISTAFQLSHQIVKPSPGTMKWNIGSPSSASSSSSHLITQQDIPSIPLPSDHPPIPSTSRRPPLSCPMSNATSLSLVPPPKCPIDYEGKSSSLVSGSASGSSSGSGLNPLNSIPLGLSPTTKAPNQTLDLPTQRETSTIPRPIPKPQSIEVNEDVDDGPTWEYPSPQQFYNALVRKGWETPEESIEMVVQIHNFLNEMAWEEVMRWERRLPG